MTLLSPNRHASLPDSVFEEEEQWECKLYNQISQDDEA